MVRDTSLGQSDGKDFSLSAAVYKAAFDILKEDPLVKLQQQASREGPNNSKTTGVNNFLMTTKSFFNQPVRFEGEDDSSSQDVQEQT